MKLFTKIKFLLMVSLVLGVMNSRAQSGTLIVIRNPEGPPTQLKRSELKYIFKGQKERWTNGKRVRIALMNPSTTAAIEMCKKIYGISADEFAHDWEEQAFGGKADRPHYCKNVDEMVTWVAENQGAIGIIDQVQKRNVLKVSIDGKESF